MDSESLAILKNIQTRLDVIEKRLETVEKGCTKMTNHVNFVEHTYTLVRRPLNYLLAKLPPLIDKE